MPSFSTQSRLQPPWHRLYQRQSAQASGLRSPCCKTGGLFRCWPAPGCSALQCGPSSFVQAVKVTGVHRAVALHHKISAAAARGGTGACRHAHRHVDVIVKQTHTGVVAVDPVTVVNVKQAAQELTVCFRRQCPGLRTTLASRGSRQAMNCKCRTPSFFSEA